ncbi:hypothetical protein [Clostridium felsineum]|uniref:Uncharacterized protein n=1 Tax=Clostridium felsineum TaxID=36839 RepID=A0A1S8LWR6_9CLOT|nr:hypothetical protein [Clostridium felsineum]URZ05920.1 hypothetical protein CLROS_012520 [Clostridium felsineum]URZ10957.1 hypothetical protein CROST_016730 [Clostridium felsineum]
MVREKIYPNYINRYYYENGDSVIYLKRYQAGKLIYSLPMIFDTSAEAEKYFKENCGA